MTKSFASLAIGIAYDKGLLNLDDRVITYFAEELPRNPHDHLASMRLSHLLTMTTGIHRNTYADLFGQPNWLKAFLAQDFPHKPGTYYRYSTHASHMLSAVIERASKQTLADFLNENMFVPMGITDVQWECAPEGLVAGGMGLSLRVSDLVKVAIMLLNRGVYNGQRIISKEYVSLATSPQVVKQGEKDEPERYFSGSEYGYQFHVMPNGAYRADGAFGQLCVLFPEKSVAVIATSQRTKTERFLALVDNCLLSSGCAKTKGLSSASLNAYLHRLSFLPADKRGGEQKVPVPHNTYKLEDNALTLQSVHFGDAHVLFEYADGVRDEIEFRIQKPVYGFSHFVKDYNFICRSIAYMRTVKRIILSC